MKKSTGLILFLIISVCWTSQRVYGCAVDTSWLGAIKPVFFFDCAGVSSTVYSDDISDAMEIYNENKKGIILAEWRKYLGAKKIGLVINDILFPRRNYEEFSGRLANIERKFKPDDFTGELSGGDGPHTLEYLNYLVYYADKSNGVEAGSVVEKNAGLIAKIRNLFKKPKEKTSALKKAAPGEIQILEPVKIGLNDMKDRALSPSLNEFLKRKWAYHAVKGFYKEKNFEAAAALYEEVFTRTEIYDISRIYAMEYYGYCLFETGKKAESLSVLLDMIGRMGDITADHRFMNVWQDKFDKEDFENYRKMQSNRHKLADSYYVRDKLDCVPLIKYEPETIRTMACVVNNLKEIYSEKLMGSRERLALETAMDIKVEMMKAINTNRELFNKPVWYLAAAYLNILTGDTKTAETMLFKANNAVLKGSDLGFQSDVLQFLLAYGKEARFSAKTEELLVKIINQYKDKTYHMDYKYNVIDSVVIISAHKYFENKDYLRSAACFYKSSVKPYGLFILDMYADNSAMLSSLDKGAGPFDAVLKKMPFGTKDDLLYIAAMKSLRKKDYISAENYVLNISPKWWDDTSVCAYWDSRKGLDCRYYYYGDSDFVIKHVNVLDSDFQAGSYVSLSKKKVISEMKKLSEAAGSADREKAAKANYRLANLYMSTPYLSYSDILWSGWMWSGIHYYLGDSTWIIDNIIPPAKKAELVRNFYGSDYNSMKISNEFFAKAASLTKDMELSARCVMGGIITEQKMRQDKRFSYAEDYWYKDEKNIENPGWEKWNMLEEKIRGQELSDFGKTYGSTEFYKSYSRTCSAIYENDKSKKKAERLKQLE